MAKGCRKPHRTKERTIPGTSHEQKWSCCSDVVAAKESYTFGDWVIAKKTTFR